MKLICFISVIFVTSLTISALPLLQKKINPCFWIVVIRQPAGQNGQSMTAQSLTTAVLATEIATTAAADATVPTTVAAEPTTVATETTTPAAAEVTEAPA